MSPQKQKKKKKKKPARISCPLSNLWLALIGGFLVIECIFLGLLAGCLSHVDMNPSVIRRKILRYLDPKWRRRKHASIRQPTGRLQQPFHRSQMRRLSRHKQQQSTTNDTGLDDFYTRPHITQQQVPFLVVGGSDGSGTRMVVQTLIELGVTQIVDNWDTMDVDGEEMVFTDERFPNGQKFHGWPPLVQRIVQETHSANYTFHNLSKATQQQAMEQLVQFKSSLVTKGNVAQAKQKMSSLPAPAAHVQYGWKAPVSMLLLPVLQQVLGPLKFLHVVRDGRDVALSDNQSPVRKFYTSFYPKRHIVPRESNYMAMELWNDWNVQVYNWARKRQQALDDNEQQTLDDMVLRTEDLMDPTTRLEALAQLADFVGARVTPEELCCRSHKPIGDMGASGNNAPRDAFLQNLMRRAGGKEDVKPLQARYGKWRQKLQGRPELLSQLLDVGAEGLRLFGYEPSERFLDRSESVESFPCGLQTMDCM